MCEARSLTFKWRLCTLSGVAAFIARYNVNAIVVVVVNAYKWIGCFDADAFGYFYAFVVACCVCSLFWCHQFRQCKCCVDEGMAWDQHVMFLNFMTFEMCVLDILPVSKCTNCNLHYSYERWWCSRTHSHSPNIAQYIPIDWVQCEYICVVNAKRHQRERKKTLPHRMLISLMF